MPCRVCRPTCNTVVEGRDWIGRTSWLAGLAILDNSSFNWGVLPECKGRGWCRKTPGISFNIHKYAHTPAPICTSTYFHRMQVHVSYTHEGKKRFSSCTWKADILPPHARSLLTRTVNDHTEVRKRRCFLLQCCNWVHSHIFWFEIYFNILNGVICNFIYPTLAY